MLSRRSFGKRITLATLGGATLAESGPALAQGYPSRPIRLVLGASAGTPVDAMLRVLAERLQARLGQSVLVDNRPGAASVIAAEFVSRQPPDGYTLYSTSPSMASARLTMAKVPYDMYKDFTYLTPMMVIPMGLLAHAGVGVNSAQELVALLKSRPGRFQYGSYGTASGNHVKMEAFLKGIGATAVHVPYKDAGQYYTGLMRGEVHFTLDAIGAQVAGIRSGSVKVLAIGTPKRYAGLPDVPTISETVLPGFQYSSWNAAVGPANMPKDIVDLLVREINAATQDPLYVAKARALNFDAVAGNPATVLEWLKDAEKDMREAVDTGVVRLAS